LFESWIPAEEEDWLLDQHADLSSLAGKDDIRIAFVARNASGNNLYLDNIEFFVVEDPRNIELSDKVSIFGYNKENIADSNLKIGFNLESRQNVKYELFDTMGRQVASAEWTNVLNQVFDLPIGNRTNSGAFIVRVNVGGEYLSTLIYLTN
jgi:hypothetical protein